MKTPRLFALTTLLFTPLLHVANRTWTGGAISNDFWSDTDNWASAVAPGSGDALIFPAGIQQTDQGMRNNLGGTILQSLRFEDADFINIADPHYLEYTLKNLTPGTSIEVSVVPMNDGGSGAASPTVSKVVGV